MGSTLTGILVTLNIYPVRVYDQNNLIALPMIVLICSSQIINTLNSFLLSVNQIL